MSVIITHKELVQIRIKILKKMTEYIIGLGDEEIWTTWIWIMGGISDAISKENYEFIAENDDKWKYTCALFGRLVEGEAD